MGISIKKDNFYFKTKDLAAALSMHSTCTSSVNGIPLEGEHGWREKEMNVTCLFEAGINNSIIASDYLYT